MDHAQVAQRVLADVGGPDNISAAAHCATRLRLVLNDPSKVDQAALDNDVDVKGTFTAGGMFQVIIGPGDVDVVYDKLIGLGVHEVSKDEAKQVAAQKDPAILRFIKMIADIFALHGRAAELTRSHMLYCLFRHLASQVVRDVVELKERADVIIANRLTPELDDVAQKVYTRDIYGRD